MSFDFVEWIGPVCSTHSNVISQRGDRLPQVGRYPTGFT